MSAQRVGTYPNPAEANDIDAERNMLTVKVQRPPVLCAVALYSVRGDRCP